MNPFLAPTYIEVRKDSLEFFHGLGFRLFPLRHSPPEARKHPALKELGPIQHNPHTLEQAVALFIDPRHGIGGYYPPDLLVLDSENMQAHAVLRKEFPELDDTLSVKTGAGAHDFVKKPEDWDVGLGMFHDAPKETAGIPEANKQLEIRFSTGDGFTHYSALPPTIHPNGTPYTFLSKTPPKEIPDFTKRFRAFIEKTGWTFSADKKNAAKKRHVAVPPSEPNPLYSELQRVVIIQDVAPELGFSGGKARGLCPKHGNTDKHADPCVFYESHTTLGIGWFACQSTSCGESGDVIKYHALKNGLKYHTAALELAEKHGITPTTAPAKPEPKTEDKKLHGFHWEVVDKVLHRVDKDTKKYQIEGGFAQTPEGIIAFERFKDGSLRSEEILGRVQMVPKRFLQLPPNFRTGDANRYVEIDFKNISEELITTYQGRASEVSEFITKKLALGNKGALGHACSLLLDERLSGKNLTVNAYPANGIFPEDDKVIFIAGENSYPEKRPLLFPNDAISSNARTQTDHFDDSVKSSLDDALRGVEDLGNLYSGENKHISVLLNGFCAGGWLGYFNRHVFKMQPYLSLFGAKELGKTWTADAWSDGVYGRALLGKDAVGSEFRVACHFATGGLATIDEAGGLLKNPDIIEMVKQAATNENLTGRGTKDQEIKSLFPFSSFIMTSNDHVLGSAPDLGGGLQSRIIFLKYPESLREDFIKNNLRPRFNHAIELLRNNGPALGVALGKEWVEVINFLGVEKFKKETTGFRDKIAEYFPSMDSRKLLGYTQILLGNLVLARIYAKKGKLPTWLDWILQDDFLNVYFTHVATNELESEAGTKNRALRFLQWLMVMIRKGQAAGQMEKTPQIRYELEKGVYGFYCDNWDTPKTVKITRQVLVEFNKDQERSKHPAYSNFTDLDEELVSLLNTKSPQKVSTLQKTIRIPASPNATRGVELVFSAVELFAEAITQQNDVTISQYTFLEVKPVTIENVTSYHTCYIFLLRNEIKSFVTSCNTSNVTKIEKINPPREGSSASLTPQSGFGEKACNFVTSFLPVPGEKHLETLLFESPKQAESGVKGLQTPILRVKQAGPGDLNGLSEVKPGVFRVDYSKLGDLETPQGDQGRPEGRRMKTTTHPFFGRLPGVFTGNPGESVSRGRGQGTDSSTGSHTNPPHNPHNACPWAGDKHG